jgi:hypothetical protein
MVTLEFIPDISYGMQVKRLGLAFKHLTMLAFIVAGRLAHNVLILIRSVLEKIILSITLYK